MDDDYGHYKTYAYFQYRSPDQTSVPPLLAPRASTEEPATSKAAQDEVSYGFGASSTCQESDQGNDAQGFNTCQPMVKLVARLRWTEQGNVWQG